jgi:hypothetical protein
MSLYVNNSQGEQKLSASQSLSGIDFTGYIDSKDFSIPFDLRLVVERYVCAGIEDEKKREELIQKIKNLDSLSVKIMAKLCNDIITIYYTPEEFSRIWQENLYRDMKSVIQKSR